MEPPGTISGEAGGPVTMKSLSRGVVNVAFGLLFLAVTAFGVVAYH